MPQVTLGEKNDKPTELHQSSDLIAVRTRSRRSLRSGPVQPAAADQIADARLELTLPEAGVEVFRIPAATAATVDSRKVALRTDPDVRFAGSVLTDDAGSPVLYTENLFIKFVDTAEPDECRKVIEAEGLTIKREVDYAVNAYFVAAPEGTGQQVFAIAQKLLAREDVEYCHPELVRQRSARAIFAQQWHLKEAVINGKPIQAHAHVLGAHEITRGEGMVIALIDDGFDIDHPELSGPSKVVAPRDATFPITHPLALNPRPKDPQAPFYADDHGTACAGVACASGREGASGVAPAAKLMPIRLAAGLGSQQEADAFKWAADHGADVISCSWGPADGRWSVPNDPKHTTSWPLPPSTRLAIDYAVTHGRQGKGCVVLFAAGNGRESVDLDGYASYSKVIAVAACNDRGTRSVYSDFGQAVWCAFPSSDFEWPAFGNPAPLTPGIWTTDRLNSLGYNPGALADGDVTGSYTNSFGGTSSSCPGAAGIAALVLAVNPALKWHEVKDVLKKGCERIDPQRGEYDPQGHSKYYGYGRLNAETAVRLARPELRDSLLVARTFNLALPDRETKEASLEVTETQTVAGLCVHVELLHTYIGDLVITLLPPPAVGGPPIFLHKRAGGSTRNLKRIYDRATTPDLGRFQNVSCAGRWTLRISDQADADHGTLVNFGVQLHFAS